MRILNFCISLTLVGLSLGASAEDAVEIGGNKISVDKIKELNQADFYEIDKKKFELVLSSGSSMYIAHFFKTGAKKAGVSEEQFMKDFQEKHGKVSEDEIKGALLAYGSATQLKDLPEAEKRKQITAFLAGRKGEEMTSKIIEDAKKSGDFKIFIKSPVEPRYDVPVIASDPVRYGSNQSDFKPVGCAGDKCPITIVEFTDLECLLCKSLQTAAKKIFANYKGKVRWIMKDLPLPFRKRARPASVAARCAKPENKFWDMYTVIFDNQKALSDDQIMSYAKKIGMKDYASWEKCYKNPPANVEIEIDANVALAGKVGIRAPPGFFINGRKLVSPNRYEQFKAIIDEELAKK